jgi:hypothetical protein
MLFMLAPLIAGIFGMNFKAIPLLQNQNGFWIAIGMMAAIATIMGQTIRSACARFDNDKLCFAWRPSRLKFTDQT